MSIHLGSPVAEVRARQLRLGDDWRDFDAVVLAAELPQGSQLVPEIGAAAAQRVWLKMGTQSFFLHFVYFVNCKLGWIFAVRCSR